MPKPRVARMPGPRRCHPHCKPGRHVLTSEERRSGGANNTKRHVFTHEECVRGGQLGFESMQLVLLEKHPDWFCKLHGGQHIAGCFLKHRNPLFFAARKLEAKVSKFKPKGPEDEQALNELKAGVARLFEQAHKRAATTNRR